MDNLENNLMKEADETEQDADFYSPNNSDIKHDLRATNEFKTPSPTKTPAIPKINGLGTGLLNNQGSTYKSCIK